jgi:hypothetical protein
MGAPTKTDGEVAHWSSRLKSCAAKAVAVESAGDVNKRWAQRKASAIPAFISHERLPGAVACVIRDSSSSGARVQLGESQKSVTVDDLPDAFKLSVMRNREYSEVECLVVRRYGDSVGVRYTGQFRTMTMPKRELGRKVAKR